MSPKNTKRIFIGSFIVSNKLYKEFDTIKNDFNNCARISWTRTVHNLHITYQFLGDTNMSDIQKINDFINNTFPTSRPIELEIKGLGYFLRNGKPSVLFAKLIEQEKILNDFYEKINKFLITEKLINPTSSTKPFRPHITLGRIKKNSSLFFDQIEKYKDYDLGSVKTIDIKVIESIISKEGAIYKAIE